MQVTSEKIRRLLTRFNVGTLCIPANKNAHLLKPAKDNPGLKVPGIYCIPCECGNIYLLDRHAGPLR
jgi:hypothetical protein